MDGLPKVAQKTSNNLSALDLAGLNYLGLGIPHLNSMTILYRTDSNKYWLTHVARPERNRRQPNAFPECSESCEETAAASPTAGLCSCAASCTLKGYSDNGPSAVIRKSTQSWPRLRFRASNGAGPGPRSGWQQHAGRCLSLYIKIHMYVHIYISR